MTKERSTPDMKLQKHFQIRKNILKISQFRDKNLRTYYFRRLCIRWKGMDSWNNVSFTIFPYCV